MKNKRKKKGSFLMTIGLLLIAAAFGLSIYNYWDGNRADKEAQEAYDKLIKEIDTTDSADPNDVNPYIDREMPTIEIDGYRYIGVLEIPSMNIKLPVMEEWDYERLKKSPCRYDGSYYTDNLIIAGHNYARHFSPIKWIKLKTDVYFTNVEGSVYHYKVDNVETLKPVQVKEMKSGDWDLTLFTCNTGGYTRCTIRCIRVDK